MDVILNQPERYTATMICDSVSPNGDRLSTIHVTMPRIILAEFNTHRRFSRNSRSTRAVPTSKLIKEVRENPYIPLRWLKNKPGMQATEEMNENEIRDAKVVWLGGAVEAADKAESLFSIGLHKQWAGRGLETYLFTDVLVSSTDWSNFMALRDHGDAQPEIELVAQRIRDCLETSSPTEVVFGAWHLPYIDDDFGENVLDYVAGGGGIGPRECSMTMEILRKISAARCARISYTPFDGNADIDSEISRYNRLVTSWPVHASPTEHIALPDTFSQSQGAEYSWDFPDEHRNFDGWRQFRAMIPNETVTEMPPRRH